MADNSVFITGIAEGSLEDTFGKLPPWASEVTAKSIENVLKKSLKFHADTFSELKKFLSNQGGKKGAIDPTKANNELDRLSRSLKEQIGDYKRQNKLSREREDLDTKENKRKKEALSGGDKAGMILASMAGAGDKVLGVFKQYISTSDELFKAGINIINGENDRVSSTEALNQMVLRTGMRLETLQGVILKYNDTLNVVGVQKFSRAIESSRKELESLGYNSEAQAELIATLMESERGYSSIRNRTAEELSTDAISLGKQLTSLSLTVGMSRDQLQQNLKANARNTDSTLVAARWGEDAAQNLAIATAGIKDTNLGKAITQMAAAAAPEFTQVFQDLVGSGMGDLATQLGALAQAGKTMDPSEFQHRLKELTDSIADGRTSALIDQIAGKNQSAQASADLVASLKQFSRGVSDATPGQTGTAVKSQSSVAALQTEVESLAASAQKTFYPTMLQIDTFTSGLRLTNSAIGDTITSINQLHSSILPFIGGGLVLATFAGALVAAIGAVKGFTFSLLSSGSPGGSGRGAGGPGGGSGRAVKFGLGAVVGGFALNQLSDSLNESGNTKGGALAGAGSSALSGAGIGAMVGSIVPGIGTAIGGAIGAGIGGAIGLYQNKDAFNTPAPSKISGPTTPQAIEAAANSQTPSAPNTSTSPGSGIERPAKGSDINNLLSYQSSLLEQMVTNTSKMVSLNQDILRYSRIG
jgi:hypothetical protein